MAGKAMVRLSLNLSRMPTPWVRVAAMVVSEMIDRLSPAMAPPTTAPMASGKDSPVTSAKPSAIGTSAPMVPMDVPIEVEINTAMTKRPGRIRLGGRMLRPMLTVASTPPIALVTLEKAPASKNTRAMVMMLRSPMPSMKVCRLSR